MQMKITLLVLLLLASMCAQVVSQEIPCSNEEAMEAERLFDWLDGWDDLYQHFKRFGHCDDGAIAEGYSDSVVHLLSSHWNHLRKLSKLSSSDSRFLAFVIRHIDATVDEGELRNVIINSERHCPKSAKTLCSLINEAAKKAWTEMQTTKEK
jgi:hypothetical protein